MKSLWSLLTAGDLVLILLLSLIGLIGLGLVLTLPVGARVVVSDGEAIRYTARLDSPGEFQVAGPLGITRLAIDSRGCG